MKKVAKFIGIAFIALGIFSCDNDDDDTPVIPEVQKNIVEVASAAPDFSILVQALTRPSLGTTYTDLLSGEGPFTVFAPTNDAFAALLAELGATSLDEVDDATLQAVLALHVVEGKVTSDILPTTATTLGGDIAIDPATATITDANGRMSKVVLADIPASNGVIHGVDKVILPKLEMEKPTIVGIATGNGDFSILVEALTRESFGTTYTDLLSGTGPFTVFAPTNDAFAALLTELGATSLDDVDDATLQAVLALHVIEGKVTSDMLPTTATTLGGDIAIDPATATITDANGRMSNVVIADVEASNGVVHAIDKVILPKQPAKKNIVEVALETPALSILVEALTRESFGTTYTDLLSGAGPFTVFAPSNDAFEALLAELGATSLDDVDDATLQAVLALHVIEGKVTSDMLPTSATTLGGDIAIDPATATITDANGRMSKVVIADVDASNGVVHVIDHVILPKL